MRTENLGAAFKLVVGFFVGVEGSPLLVLCLCEPGQGRNAATVAYSWCASEIRAGAGLEDNLQLAFVSISGTPTLLF
jgi:hypothetical protein